MKNSRITKPSALVPWFCLLVCASCAPAQVYQVTDLGILPGQTSSSAVGINQSGQVAGNSGNHAFIYSNGVLTDLGFVAGSNQSTASAINDKGQIVGNYVAASSQFPQRAFLWQSGTMSDPFNSLGFLSSQSGAVALGAAAINNTEQVALNFDHYEGYSTANSPIFWPGPGSALTSIAGDGQTYAINNQSQVALTEKPYYTYGAVHGPNGTTQLPNLDAADAGYGPTPYGINDNGQVVGVALTNYNNIGGSRAFSWSSGTITDLGTLGGTNSVAYAVNKPGVIVGNSELVKGSSATHAFVYSAGQMLDLNTRLINPQLWNLQSAVGINDLGQIVGNGMYAGAFHGFLLTPQASGSIYPTHGGNAGKVTVLIVSPGFVPSAIKLSGPGGSINGSAVTVPSYLPSAVQTTFDLIGVQPGVYSLALSQGDSTPTTLSNVFTVDQGGAPDIRIGVAGFPQLRGGVSQTYYLVATNQGNEDAPTVNVWSSFPAYLDWNTLEVFPNAAGQVAGSTLLKFQLPVSVASTVVIPIMMKAQDDPSLAHTQFYLQSWSEERQ